ncbi:inactive hydroxysteroid dehydrogenase-like protein 1 [Ochlerotatus camptorhynchus]|uniref:inactive hydroxysteroid dehydrogenase-like protein 1 n=1 Tax=Ochlerotatus camptorhynchus TaxID=644619 RepID=UPI0031DC6737
MFNLLGGFCFYGIYMTILWAYNSFLESLLGIIWGSLRSWVTKEKLTERYGPWAVITGATDGIGKRYAENLASQGLNIVLISRSEVKLIKVANELYEKYNVETRWIAVDFTKGPHIYKPIQEELSMLDIGLLVNNVGFHSSVRCFDLNTEEDILSTINVNVMATTLMTRIVLPGMKQRRRGIVINISSVAGYVPSPYINVYGASKAYVNHFSLAMSHELRGTGVECQVVVPSVVKTNMSQRYQDGIPWFMSVANVEELGRFGVFTIGKTMHTCGGWMHAFQVCWKDVVPSSWAVALIAKVTVQGVGR